MLRESPPSTTSCRLCAVRCEQVVHPAGCLAAECDRLYSYVEDGRMFVGCLERVFAVDIDLELFRELDGRRQGFGGLRVVRAPLPVCRTSVEAAMPHRLTGKCRNPGMGSPVTTHGTAGADRPPHDRDGRAEAIDQGDPS